jgi:hypothetical protein
LGALKMPDNQNIGSIIKSAAGNLFFAFLTILGVAFLSGIPVGKAAREFSNTMFPQNSSVQYK